MLVVWMREVDRKKLMDLGYLMSIIIIFIGWMDDELLDVIWKIYKD